MKMLIERDAELPALAVGVIGLLLVVGLMLKGTASSASRNDSIKVVVCGSIADYQQESIRQVRTWKRGPSWKIVPDDSSDSASDDGGAGQPAMKYGFDPPAMAARLVSDSVDLSGLWLATLDSSGLVYVTRSRKGENDE